MTDVRLPLSPEKWVKIRDIYDRLLNVPESERIALAHTLCEGDTEIEAETSSLLSAHAKAGSFLHSPAAEALESIVSKKSRRELSIGTVLATRFRILELLNTGGMGSVYEAFDSELQEVVALKTIRPEIASEAAIIERFKQEVRQARQITHPNVCRVYDLFNHDFGPGDRIWFLTMQLLAGTTLLDHIRQNGPIPEKEAFVLVEQMVAGLSAAHQHGIIHRDFKSSNVMLVPETDDSIRVVITDFGLAIQTTAVGYMENAAGQGTPAYVAPEQWNKGVVAPAGDQYSLGVVMCEMLTGERPAALAADEGSARPVKLPAGRNLDAHWESAICRCLEVKPENRFTSLDDLIASIDPGRRRKILLRWTAGVAALLLLAALAHVVVMKPTVSPILADLTQLTPSMDFSVSPSLSTDGKWITYVSDRAESGNQDVWVQQLPHGPARRLTSDPAIDEHPSISADGTTVAFESSREHPGIYITQMNVARAKFLVPDAHDPRFSPVDRSFLYWSGDVYMVQPGSKIYRYDTVTGTSNQLAADMIDAFRPIWNSDGRHILFIACGSKDTNFPACRDWWVTTKDGAPPRKSGAVAILNAQHLSSTGYFGGWQGNTVVFSALHGPSMGLWSIKIDPESGKAYGVAQQLLPGSDKDFIISSSLVGNSLAFGQMNPAIHVWRIDNPTHPHSAKAYKITNDPEFDFGPSVSPDGRSMVLARGFSGDRKLYIADIASGAERILNVQGSSKVTPVFDPSSSHIAYEAMDRGVPSIFLTDLDGVERKLCAGCRNPTGWLQKPESLLISDESLAQVRMLDTTNGNTRTILSIPGGSVRDAVWSPRTQFIVFTVARPGALGQLFAARFPPGASQPDNHWIQITEASKISRKPEWSLDGRTIFYLSQRDGFWCVWGQRFDPHLAQTEGQPFAVQHFHNLKMSPSEIGERHFKISAAQDSLYFNVAETGGTIWVGRFAHKPLLTK